MKFYQAVLSILIPALLKISTKKWFTHPSSSFEVQQDRRNIDLVTSVGTEVIQGLSGKVKKKIRNDLEKE